MATQKKLWAMDGHTEGKHLVLRAYLDAWFGILSNKFNTLLFVDGFSGPGEYSTGEDGSPLIALKSVIEHSHKELENTQVRYIFIEYNPERLSNLKEKISQIAPNIPKNIHLEFIDSSFESATNSTILPALKALSGSPCFIMIDPFGVDQTPMNSLQQLMKYPRVELYISLMYEFINRFKSREQFESPLNNLFGCTDWQQLALTEDRNERKQQLYQLYKNNLKQRCAAQVVHFDLYSGNRLKYGVFFATKSILGSQKIKEAIWKVIPNGDYAFRSEADNQLTINLDNPDFLPLQNLLIRRFKGRGYIPIKSILDFIASDCTIYHRGQVKTHGLKVIEKDYAEHLTVRRNLPKVRRALTYPDDCEIQIE